MLDRLPEGTLQGGIKYANELYWNISVYEGKSGQQWFVKAGESTIFKTDSKECLDAFLYGLGLAYSVLPGPVFDQLRAELKQWVE